MIQARISQRAKFGLRASVWHLLGSAMVAGVAAALVFMLWYPGPYRELSGGSHLFLIVISIDLVCGPLLTLILFNPTKTKRELALDLGLVVLVQLAALVYGLYTVALARPVYLAFEKDRYRVIAQADVLTEKLSAAPLSLRTFSYQGPQMLGVRVAKPEDADYLQELEQSINGRDSSFRPERWVIYETQVAQVLAKVKPLEELVQKYPQRADELRVLVAATGLREAQVAWLPISARNSMAWVALVDKTTAAVVGYAPFDGF
jgi:hypothetical protein